MWFKFRFFFRNNIYIYIFGCQIRQIHVYHIIVFFINIIIQRHLYKAFQWHPLGLKRTRLVISLSWLPLFISRCHLIIYIYCLQNDGKCCQARAEWIFQTSLFFFSLLRDELWDTKSELCVVRIPSNLHVCFLNRACSLIPPSFSANRQEMQPGRSAIKQTLALKGVRGFVPARFAC